MATKISNTIELTNLLEAESPVHKHLNVSVQTDPIQEDLSEDIETIVQDQNMMMSAGMQLNLRICTLKCPDMQTINRNLGTSSQAINRIRSAIFQVRHHVFNNIFIKKKIIQQDVSIQTDLNLEKALNDNKISNAEISTNKMNKEQIKTNIKSGLICSTLIN